MKSEINRINLSDALINLFVYKSILEFIYVFAIYPAYDYMGFTLVMNPLSYLFSMIFLFVVIYYSPKEKDQPSTYLFILIEMLVLIPIITFYWLSDKSTIYTFYIVICTIVIAFMLKMKFRTFGIKLKHSYISLKIIFVAYVIVTTAIIIIRGGIDLRTLNFDSIYELRNEYNLPASFGYLTNWSVKVFGPFYLSLFYLNKKYFGIAIVIVLQLLMYLSFGNKAFLFSIGLVLLNLVFTKKDVFLRKMTLVLSSLNVLGSMFYSAGATDLILRTITYRTIFIPAQIQYYYFEFFTRNSNLFFSESLIGRLFSIDSPYGRTVSLIIGDLYYKAGAGINANTGIFADAFANGDFIVMIIVSVFFGLLLNIIDVTTKNIPVYVVVGALGYIIFTINDAPFLTTLLTGGLFLMMIMFIILNSCLGKEHV